MAEITLTDVNFGEDVLKSTLLVLVDFWAPGAGTSEERDRIKNI